jgi:outer membrane lipoprotein-sorting protein
VRPTILLGLLALVLRGALAQAPPDVAEILKRVSETYKGVSEYELVGDATASDPETGKPGAFHVVFAFKGPNRYRMEGVGPGTGLDDLVFADMVMVYDGSVAWFYRPKSNQYGYFLGNDLFNDFRDGKYATPEAMDDFMTRRCRSAEDFSDEATFLREEAMEVGGAKIECYVVSMTDGTWWIDKKSNRIVRQDHDETSTVFTTIKLGEPLPDSLFKFVPPAGAKQIERQ